MVSLKSETVHAARVHDVMTRDLLFFLSLDSFTVFHLASRKSQKPLACIRHVLVVDRNNARGAIG